MSDELAPVEIPVPYYDAFASDDYQSRVSQAAFYLALGSMLHPEWRKGIYSEEGDPSAFPLPELSPLDRKLSLRTALEFGRKEFDFGRERGFRDVAGKVAERLRSRPSIEDASFTLTLGLHSASPLVQMSAWISCADHFDVVATPSDMVVPEPSSAENSLARELFVTWMARQLTPYEGSTAVTAMPPPPSASKTAPTTCVLVNGTLFPGSSIFSGMPDLWWRPGGDLYDHLQRGTRPNVTHFEWEGSYHLFGHEVAANNFCNWQMQNNLQTGMDVITHSHGGNMTFLATHRGLQVRKLVLLSCPVHWSRRQPLFHNVGSIQSIRIHSDLVLLADRAGQMFPRPIPDLVLPLWFISHGDSRRSSVWRKYMLDRFV